jgi:hypothetical protein
MYETRRSASVFVPYKRNLPHDVQAVAEQQVVVAVDAATQTGSMKSVPVNFRFGRIATA